MTDDYKHISSPLGITDQTNRLLAFRPGLPGARIAGDRRLAALATGAAHTHDFE